MAALLARAARLWRRFVAAYNAIDDALYPVIGLKSYEKYLAHWREHHGDAAPPMSRAEFFRASQDAKEKNVKC